MQINSINKAYGCTNCDNFLNSYTSKAQEDASQTIWIWKQYYPVGSGSIISRNCTQFRMY